MKIGSAIGGAAEEKKFIVFFLPSFLFLKNKKKERKADLPPLVGVRGRGKGLKILNAIRILYCGIIVLFCYALTNVRVCMYCTAPVL